MDERQAFALAMLAVALASGGVLVWDFATAEDQLSKERYAESRELCRQAVAENRTIDMVSYDRDTGVQVDHVAFTEADCAISYSEWRHVARGSTFSGPLSWWHRSLLLALTATLAAPAGYVLGTARHLDET